MEDTDQVPIYQAKRIQEGTLSAEDLTAKERDAVSNLTEKHMGQAMQLIKGLLTEQNCNQLSDVLKLQKEAFLMTNRSMLI